MVNRYKDRITILDDQEIEDLYGLPRLAHDEQALRDPLIFYFWMPLDDLFDDIAHQMSAYRLLQPSESCRAPQP